MKCIPWNTEQLMNFAAPLAFAVIFVIALTFLVA